MSHDKRVLTIYDSICSLHLSRPGSNNRLPANIPRTRGTCRDSRGGAQPTGSADWSLRGEQGRSRESHERWCGPNVTHRRATAFWSSAPRVLGILLWDIGSSSGVPTCWAPWWWWVSAGRVSFLDVTGCCTWRIVGSCAYFIITLTLWYDNAPFMFWLATFEGVKILF